MYTDEDLEGAVNKGIFTNSSVRMFREYILERNNTHVADEENFRLIASFNDIRVTRKSDVAFWLHLTSAPLSYAPSFFNFRDSRKK